MGSRPRDNTEIAVIRGNVVRGCVRLGSFLVSGKEAFLDSASARIITRLLSCGCGKGPLRAVSDMVTRLENSFTLKVVFGSFPSEIFTIHHRDPLVMNITRNRYFVTSSIPTVLRCAQSCCLLSRSRVMALSPSNISFISRRLSPVRGGLRATS